MPKQFADSAAHQSSAEADGAHGTTGLGTGGSTLVLSAAGLALLATVAVAMVIARRRRVRGTVEDGSRQKGSEPEMAELRAVAAESAVARHVVSINEANEAILI